MILTSAEQFKSKAAKRTHVMAKPIGAVCNLDCDYCYYLSKESLLNYRKGLTPKMDLDTLENFIKSYIEGQNTAEVVFTWQGGEPTMLGLSYFEKVVELQNKYRPDGVVISNDLQTNGVLLNDKWCEFLKKHNWLVGLSIDGSEMLHNVYRVNKAGKGTFKQVMKAVDLLHEYDIDFCALACVNNVTGNEPIEVYRFLRDAVKPLKIQFTPVVERSDFESVAPYQGDIKQSDPRLSPKHINSIVKSWSVAPEQWGNFMKAVFDEWYANDIGKVYVNYIEDAFQVWQGLQGDMCTLSKICGKGLAIEPNGDLFSCDHYVYPEYKLGNINESSIDHLAYSNKQQSFGFGKSKSLNSQCQTCSYKFACYGECPRNRFIATENGEQGLNYLCKGWYMFFSHIEQPLSVLLKSRGYRVNCGQYKTGVFSLNFRY